MDQEVHFQDLQKAISLRYFIPFFFYLLLQQYFTVQVVFTCPFYKLFHNFKEHNMHSVEEKEKRRDSTRFTLTFLRFQI